LLRYAGSIERARLYRDLIMSTIIWIQDGKRF
jgi:hypothetical protein